MGYWYLSWTLTFHTAMSLLLDLMHGKGILDRYNEQMYGPPPPTLIIFNKSLQQSKYPSNWMSTYVIEIFKKGDTSLPSNYGPISLISCVGKLMERIVYKQVYNHLVNNSLIYEYQSGFLPKHSTVHQLLELYNSILNTLEKK
jgi:hypothetical protein